MTTFLTFLVDCFGSFVGWIGGLELVSGVSLLSFFIALIVIGILINSLLLRGR